MMKRRFFSILTALALSLTLLPAAARAADGQPAIQTSLGSITGYTPGLATATSTMAHGGTSPSNGACWIPKTTPAQPAPCSC